MFTMDRSTIRSLYKYTGFFLLIFSSVPLVAQEEFLCIWRNPERTMTRLFPQAKDYKTITVPISSVQREAIERQLGEKLLPGQRDQYQYFEMKGTNDKVIGYTVAASQKGEFGVIEFVLGINSTFEIVGIYIQRSRERDNAFKEQGYLDSFKGIRSNAIPLLTTMTKERTGIGIIAIASGVRKEMMCIQKLVVEKGH